MFNQSPGGFTCPITSPTVSILNNPSKTGLRDKMPCATVAIQDENVSNGKTRRVSHDN
ncbi:hypothetical protein Hanom_Chr05g00468641 [Helianthus anomalus]